jgi:creatinine amidohydrolase
MRIEELNWMQVEAYLENDDRCVVPIGSTEQHAYLSLSVDSILSEKVAVDAAETLGVPVFPRLNYGITPYFTHYPGTVSLRVETALALVRDVLDSLHNAGFRRILMVNGHGGNNPVAAMIQEWMAGNGDARVRFHNWWMAPRTWAKVKAIDPVASHASWMENFPWTRLPGVTQPEGQKSMVDLDRLRMLNPRQVRDYVGDGNYGGDYQKADDLMLALWEVAVAETRDLIDGPWD